MHVCKVNMIGIRPHNIAWSAHALLIFTMMTAHKLLDDLGLRNFLLQRWADLYISEATVIMEG